MSLNTNNGSAHLQSLTLCTISPDLPLTNDTFYPIKGLLLFSMKSARHDVDRLASGFVNFWTRALIICFRGAGMTEVSMALGFILGSKQ